MYLCPQAEKAERLALERDAEERKFEKRKMAAEAYLSWRDTKQREAESRRKERQRQRVTEEEEEAYRDLQREKAKEAYVRWREQKDWVELVKRTDRQTRERHRRSMTSPASKKTIVLTVAFVENAEMCKARGQEKERERERGGGGYRESITEQPAVAVSSNENKIDFASDGTAEVLWFSFSFLLFLA